MRDRTEIQKAHDILWILVNGHIPWPDDTTRENKHIVRACLDVLCWTLQHDHNRRFGANFASLEKELERLGYVLQDGGKPA